MYRKTHSTHYNTVRNVKIGGVYRIGLLNLTNKETLFCNKNYHYVPLNYNSVKYIYIYICVCVCVCLNARGQVKRGDTLGYTLRPKTKNEAITLFLWTSRNKCCYCRACLKQFNAWSPQDVKFSLLHPYPRYINRTAI